MATYNRKIRRVHTSGEVDTIPVETSKGQIKQIYLGLRTILMLQSS